MVTHSPPNIYSSSPSLFFDLMICQTIPYRVAVCIGYWVFFIYLQNLVTSRWQKCMVTMAHSMEIQNVETVVTK